MTRVAKAQRDLIESVIKEAKKNEFWGDSYTLSLRGWLFDDTTKKVMTLLAERRRASRRAKNHK